MRVWVYPEKTWEELGAERWEVEWQVLTEGARKRHEADPGYEHDHYQDEQSVCRHYPTKAKAIKAARAVVNLTETVYGCATVTRQVVDWHVEEDRVAEWASAGEPEYVS